VVRTIVLAGLIASMTSAVAYGQRADSGILTICNASGARPVTGTFVYTAAAPASAGGALTFNVAVGTCAPRVFWPLGTSVTVIENVPTGFAVTGITLAPTAGGGGTTSVISSNTPAAGTATVTIGDGQATLTFTTSGPATGGGGGKSPCKVPNVFGLALTAATAAIRRGHCTVGIVHKVYSNVYYPGRVYSESPQRGTVLAPGAPVNLTVSLGHHP
jgi:PASTA domain